MLWEPFLSSNTYTQWKKITIYHYINYSVYGQGYQYLASKLDYIIRSSPSNPVPTSFVGSNPIHIQLENSPSGSNRFVDITLSKQIVLSGLAIQTVANMALASFSLSYAERGTQYPDRMSTFTRLLNDKQVLYCSHEHFTSLVKLCHQ